MREIVLDTETTGLYTESGHRIIEIGALELYNKSPTGKKFHTYINPLRSVGEPAYKIHGISTEFLQNKPKFADIVTPLLLFLDKSPLVIHNAQFDMKFLNYELSLLNTPQIPFDRAIDTLSIARKLFPGSRVNLDALCKRFKIDISHRAFHGALKDAELLMLVYIEMVGKEQTSLNLGDQQNLTNEKMQLQLQVKPSTKVIYASEDEIKDHITMLKLIPNSLWNKG